MSATRYFYDCFENLLNADGDYAKPQCYYYHEADYLAACRDAVAMARMVLCILGCEMEVSLPQIIHDGTSTENIHQNAGTSTESIYRNVQILERNLMRQASQLVIAAHGEDGNK